MQLTIRLIDCERTDFAGLEPAEFLEDAFAKFQQKLRHIFLYVEDVNGPRGGNDKQVRCVLHLKRQAPIVIQGQGDNLPALIHNIAERAVHALRQKAGRKITNRRERQKQETFIS